MNRIVGKSGFAVDESGGGTIFALFLFMIMAIILGVMVDSTNAWRNSTMLASAADMGSHAGAVALANGASEAEVAASARAQVRRNLNVSVFGDTVGETGDVALMHYDRESGRLSLSGEKNAVAVTASRLEERRNPVGTFLLSFAGVFSWDVNAVSAAIYDYASECRGTDGIYGESQIRASSSNHFGRGYCVHSNDSVWLPQGNSFDAESLVSMPDLADCGNKCTHDANPGIKAAELNMIFPDFGDYIQGTFNAFEAPGLFDGTVKGDFFATRQVGDLEGLFEANVLPEGYIPVRGEVVTLTHDEFHALEELPSGLVYSVSCPSSGNSAKTKLAFSGTVAKVTDAAILTNCSLDFADGAVLRGSLVITTRDSASATVTGGESVEIGDGVPGQCSPEDRTTIMSVSGVSVPAKMVASNVTMVVDDTVDIASSSALGDTSYGLTIYATGPVDIASQHRFESCGADEVDEILVPRGKVIRHVATN